MQNDFRSRAEASLISIQQTCSMCPPLHCTMFSRRRCHSPILRSRNACDSCCQAVTIARFSSCTDVNVLRFAVVNHLLKRSPNSIVHRIQIRAVWGPHVRLDKVSKPLGLSFDAALSSGKNFTRWRHFKQQDE